MTDKMKICASCGRSFEMRRRWKDCWEAVRYCSRGCRSRGIRRLDRRLEAAILELLESRQTHHTICPSEAARVVANGDEWRDLMEPARRAARRLVHQNRVEITQRGHVVDPDRVRGPIRVRAKD
ncbi:MAG: DUF3253 domain-containing protein [Gammaproteobacteria bacterium]|nr:DUF3253 domain-containing protein [Gammaproteobacteria bacterium]